MVVDLASNPQPPALGAPVHCGFRPGPTGVTLPSRQDDESVKAPPLCCCCGEHGTDWWRARGECTVNTNTLPRLSCCSVVTRSPSTLCQCISRHSNTIFAFSACLTSKRESARFYKSRFKLLRLAWFWHLAASANVRMTLKMISTFVDSHRHGFVTHLQILQGLLFQKLHVFACMPMSIQVFLNNFLVLLQVYFNLQFSLGKHHKPCKFSGTRSPGENAHCEPRTSLLF